MQEIILRCGHSVHSVATKQEALAYIAQQSVDLIITAIMLSPEFWTIF